VFANILTSNGGYCVDTIGLDEEKIKKYIQYQEKQERLDEEQRLDFCPLYGSFKSTFLEGGFFNLKVGL
jgi:hypothetical protein